MKSDGWFLYEVSKHALLKMGNEDLRIYGGTQDFVKAAPVILVYVADFGRMNDTTDELRKFFSAVDVGLYFPECLPMVSIRRFCDNHSWTG